MARFLSFLLIMFLARLVLRQVALWMSGGAARQVRDARSEHATDVYKGVMVRDPVCGLHLPEARALVEHRTGARHFFCSERCRDAFQRAS
jgi:YHS domain-containing protein